MPHVPRDGVARHDRTAPHEGDGTALLEVLTASAMDMHGVYIDSLKVW